MNDLKFVRQRTIGPDVLDVITRDYKLKGSNAMRLFLRSRGQPDKTNNALPISPKQIKDMAVQLGTTPEDVIFRPGGAPSDQP